MSWRDPGRAGWLMWAYFLVSLSVSPALFVHGGPGEPKNQPQDYVVIAFLAWRVARGGRFSRVLLLIGAEAAFLETASGIAAGFGPRVLWQLTACAVQVALLLSAAVYRRTRPPGWTATAGWDRLRPPAALLVLGVLAGLVVTLLCLGHMTYLSYPGFRAAPLSGCDHGDAGRLPASLCQQTLAEGGPLYWLTAFQGSPVVDWAAMARDWGQWTVVSTSVLYGFWLSFRARDEPVTLGVPAVRIVASALAGLAVTVLTGGIPLTWLTAGQYGPLPGASAIVADTALWTGVALWGCLPVRPPATAAAAPG
jgi:hypothetical protein